MAPSNTLTTKVESGSPYQLDKQQTLKAATALVKHITSSEKEAEAASDKKTLIADEDDEDASSTTVWLTLTTKKHIVDQKRLKPAKISVPHPINTSSTDKICLIVADPGRLYKDIISSPAFPSELGSRITKVVAISKIRAKWTQYEAQRKLLAEYDIFLADDRIITLLPKLLGKTFYKSSTKRPIPVSIEAPAPKTDGKKIKKAKGEPGRGAAAPKAIAAEIEKAIQGALVHLSASTCTSVRVGAASWEPTKLAENITCVAETLIEKFVPQKWHGVRSIHIKGPNTMALPIWLADELWTNDTDVLDKEEIKKVAEANVGKKRKAKVLSAPSEETLKKQKTEESNDAKLDEEIKARKESLKKQKAAANEVLGDSELVPAASKKVKKSKSKTSLKA